jgi:hypothetical protein
MILRTAIIAEGQTISIYRGTLVGSGTISYSAVCQTDTILTSVYVASLSGTVKVKVFTFSQEGELEITDFALISAPTPDLVIKQASATLSNIRLELTYTGDCDVDIAMKGISGGSSGSMQIIGPTTGNTSTVTVTPTVGILIAAAANDRKGLIFKNWTPSSTLYIGFTALTATLASGWPMVYGESLAVDVEAGQVIYGISASGNIDVRVLEVGG